MAVVTAAPDAVRVVADVIAPWFPVGTDESFKAGAREILDALVEAGWREPVPTSDLAMAGPAAPRFPVVESLDDAVRVVEDTIDATSDRVFASGGGRLNVMTDRTARAIVEALIADPTVIARRNDAGAFELETRWPDDAVACLISRKLLDEIVVELNASRTLVVRIRATLDGAP